MWVPANRFMLADGDHDSAELALEYMEHLIGDLPPASSRARKEAFVYNAPKMQEFYESLGLKFRRTTGYPDYFPHYPGGQRRGARNRVGDLEHEPARRLGRPAAEARLSAQPPDGDARRRPDPLREADVRAAPGGSRRSTRTTT